MKIAISGFMHETNTFVPTPTVYEDFLHPGEWPDLCWGETLPNTVRGANIAIAHFMEAAEAAGHEILPLAWGMAQPSGIVTKDAFERLSAHVLEELERVTPDLLFIELHGAMVAEGYDDAETEFLRRVRAVTGPDLPIVGTLDLHANVSQDLVDLMDLLSAYRTYPHVDWGATGTRVFTWLDRLETWGWHPARAHRRIPYMMPTHAQSTYAEPARALYQRLEEIETETGVHLSLNMGFSPADIAIAGPTVLAYGADQATVDMAADALTEAVMEAEPRFLDEQAVPVEGAVAMALRALGTVDGPIVLADTQDNPGGGGPANTTGLIKELLAQQVDNALVLLFHDADMASAAHEAGIGAVLNHKLGIDGPIPGQEALPGPWTVTHLSEGAFRATDPMLNGNHIHMGPVCVVRQQGVSVIVSTLRHQAIGRGYATHLGIDPSECSVIGLKSTAHFRADWQPIAGQVIVCAAPGPTLANPMDFPYTKLPSDMRRLPRAA
ncbi:MAG: M81 family metallopeptidase [Pseudomonadota bacterium]